MKKAFLLLGQILNPKTIYFNFKYFPFKQVVKLPVFITFNTYLLKTGGRIIIEGPVKTGMIRIGFGHVGIFDKKKNRAIWEVRGNIHFRGPALFKFGSKTSVGDQAQLSIGKKFRLSPESKIICFYKINIGDNVRVSWESILMDTDFHKILTLDGKVINHPREIIIGNDVWIGMRVTILKGTIIQNNNIIASNTFLNKPIPGSNNIIGGHPASILKSEVTWVE